MRASAVRLLTILLLPAVIGLPMVGEPRIASADTAPPDASMPQTVSSDPLPTAQHNGVVWAQVVVGNVVYAAGEFTRARPAGAAKGSAAEVVRTNLLAYDIRDGRLTDFAPTMNGMIKDIAVAPDGSAIYIGGQFTQVNGATRYRLAGFSTATGALLTGFFPNLNATVNGLAVSANTVYIGGTFTTVNGQPRINAGAVDRLTGAIRPSFDARITATAGRSVWQVAVSPLGDKVVIGGNFETVNGSTNPGYGLAMLAADTGALLPTPVNSLIRNGRENAAITGLEATAEGFYGTGYAYLRNQGNFEGTFKADWNGNLVWMQDCHGDTYAVFPAGNDVYTAGHAHYCGNVGGFPQTSPTWTYNRAIAFSDDVRGTISRETLGYYNFEGQPRPALLTWFPDINAGTYTGQNQGPWSISGNNDYVVYGGEFTTVNNQGQEGLVRFARNAPHDDGPRLGSANFVPTVRSFAQGLRLSWPANYDRDNEELTYRLIRDGNLASPIYTTTVRSTFWQRPYLSFLDPVPAGESHTYRIRVTDPKGNIADGGTISATRTGGQSLSSYDLAALRDSPQSYWPLDETSGTTAVDVSSSFNGTLGTGVTTGVPGAISGQTGTGYRFNATTASTVGATPGTPRAGPQIFSIETWFKTTSTTGGKLIGFGTAASGNSASYDRHIYLSNTGRLTFAVYNGTQRTLSPTTTYRDGLWHHVVGTLSPAGMTFYVDGALAAERKDVVYAQIINTGYWRIGGDNTSSWVGSGSNGFYPGDLDNVAVYHHPLTAAQVAAHYAARSGTAPNQPPNAAFTSTSSALTASFNASGSADVDGTIASYAWNFGDGTTGTGVSPTRTYGTAGTRNVTLTVTDDDGATASVTRPVTVTAPANDPPTASFTSSCPNLSCTFNGTGSSDPGGSISSYAWNFGDGTTGTTATPTHVYPAAGTYTVTLTVTDNGGATDGDTQTVSPSAPPPGSPFASDAFGGDEAVGFGTADVGGAWTTSAAGDHSVAGGAGRINLATAAFYRTAYVGSATSTSADVTTTMSLGELTTGTAFLEVTGRRVGANQEYDGLVKIASSGVVSAGLRRFTGTASAADVTAAVNTGITYTAGMSLKVRVQVTGTAPTTLRMKVWPASAAEPANWLVTGTDSTASLQAAGAPGLRGYLSASTTILPILWQVDDFVARPVDP